MSLALYRPRVRSNEVLDGMPVIYRCPIHRAANTRPRANSTTRSHGPPEATVTYPSPDVGSGWRGPHS